MRALSPYLHEAGQKLWWLHTDGYVIESSTTRIHKVKDLEHSARRVPDRISSVSLEYENLERFTSFLVGLFAARPNCSLSLQTRWWGGSENVRVSLEIKGPDTDTMAGKIDRAKKQIDSEFARQESANWSADPPTMNFPAHGLVRRIRDNQWFVGLVFLVLSLILAVQCSSSMPGGGQTTNPSSVTSSVVVSTPAPSVAPEPVTPPTPGVPAGTPARQ